MRRGLLPHALTLTTLACAGAASGAHASWTAPQTLARQPAAEQLAATGNAERAELFAWKVTTRRHVRTRTQSGPASYVRARLRLASGRFGTARTISSTRELVAGPAVALDARGGATVVWAQAGRTIRIMGSHRRRGGRFSRPFEIGRTSAFHGARPALAVAPGGAVVVVWNGGTSIRTARRPGGRCRSGEPRGCFGTTQSFARGADHAIAMSGGGSAFLVWAAHVRRAGALGTGLRLAIAPRNRSFGRPRAIDSPGNVSQPSISVAPGGSAVIAWRASLPAGGEQNADAPIFAAIRAASGSIFGPQVVALLPGSDPQVRTNARNEAILAWNGRNPSPQNPDGTEVFASYRALTVRRSWVPPVQLAGPGVAAGSASVAVDSAGNAVVAYSAASHTSQYPIGPVAFAHRRAAGAGFGPGELLGADFTGAFVFGAGARITAASGGSEGRTLVSDYVAG